MSKYKLIAVLMITFTMILAACNTDDESPDENEDSSDSITISGDLEDVELDEEAETVVALEWTYAEDLIAVDHEPAGVADIDGFHQFVNIGETLSDDVIDVGTRQEPNLETIASLDPDLIIGITFRHEGIRDQLEAIAPTVFFNPYPEEDEYDQYEEMEDTFRQIAKAVGKEEDALAVIDSLNDKYSEAEEAINDAALDTNETILTYGWSADQAPIFRLFTPNSMASIIMEKVGLTNPYEPDSFEAYGYSEVNVEAFTNYEDANYLYIVENDDDLYEGELANHSVWNGLNFVEEGRTYQMESDTWLFGGPLSAEVLVEQITESMMSE
ncbi:iron-siderophore ABC transporter substrate-binding protein [Alkalibacillus silvisoli]|uniref:Iron-siderophore ABC transporter substrate-binding protein n=1 Tax=Alkalibacillus silvisoli TaxID=392823 RepID=A0ABP3JK67_9BACI